MFEQALDKGGEWIDVSRFTADHDLVGYQYEVVLDQRADAILIHVTLEKPEADWTIAGDLLQYWKVDELDYQTAYSKVYLQQNQVIEISSLASSRLVFRAVTWLRDWTITIKARLAPVTNQDILSQIADAGQGTGGGCNISSSQVLLDIREKLDIICQHLEIEPEEPEEPPVEPEPEEEEEEEEPPIEPLDHESDFFIFL